MSADVIPLASRRSRPGSTGCPCLPGHLCRTHRVELVGSRLALYLAETDGRLLLDRSDVAELLRDACDHLTSVVSETFQPERSTK